MMTQLRRSLGSLPSTFAAVAIVAALGSFAPSAWTKRRPRETPSTTPVTKSLHFLQCHDGDTCRARQSDGLVLKLRLLGMDAPETSHGGQAYGKEAREELNRRVRGKDLPVEIRGSDVYGRSLAIIYAAPGRRLNEELIREGYAYAYRGKGAEKEIRTWAEKAETEAKRAKRGLWGLPKPPEDPADFRRRRRR